MVPRMAGQNINPIRRLLKIEPGISLGQWVWDKTPESWRNLVTGSVAAADMSYLASISAWVRPWGPVGYGAIAIVSTLTVLIGLLSCKT